MLKPLLRITGKQKCGSAVLSSHSRHLTKALTLSQSSVIIFGEELRHLPRHTRADGMTCQPESLRAVKDAGYLDIFWWAAGSKVLKSNCLKKTCWMAGFWRQSKSNPSIHSKWEGCVAKLVYVGVFGHWKVAKRCHLQAQTSSEHLPEEPQLLHGQPAVRARMPWAPLSAAGHAQVLRLCGADWLVLDPGTLLGRNGVKSQLGRSSGYCLLQPELFPARHCTYHITTEGNSVIVHSSTHRAACARHLRDFCS